MVVGFPTTCAISAYHHYCCEFEPRSIQHYVIKFDSTLVSSTNKTDRHDIAEILLKVALDTINLNLFNHNRLTATDFSSIVDNASFFSGFLVP
jgi:hypothetical protein